MGKRTLPQEIGSYLEERPLLTATIAAAAGFLAVAGTQRLLHRFRRPEQAITEYSAYRELTWQLSEHSPDGIQLSLITGDGQRANKQPQKIGVLTADRSTVDDFQRRWGGVHAIAYLAEDDHIMIGVDAHDEGEPLLATDPTDDARYALGVRVGDSNLLAAIGVWAPDRGVFLGYNNAVHIQPTTPDTITQDFPGISFVIP